MNDGRRRRSAKQGRRDARRDTKRKREGRDDNLVDRAVRKALAKHPLALLSFASFIIGTATPDRFAYARRDARETPPLAGVVAALAGRRCRETTALLAVLAEMLVDDEVLRDQCRRELATRNEPLPKWLAELSRVDAYRVVRERHILGDGDNWLLGVRMANGSEFTIAMYVDHNWSSAVTNVGGQMKAIDQVADDPRRAKTADTVRIDEDLADARAWIGKGLLQADWLPQDDSRRQSLPLVAWLMTHLPEGGTARTPGEVDDQAMSELADGFFASSVGAPFRDVTYRDLLMQFWDTGSGDPSRWSATRVAHALQDPSYDDDIPVEIAVDAPALLRAFIPFAHSRSGVRQAFTDEATATIDSMSLQYKRRLLVSAAPYIEDDVVEPPPWLRHPDKAS